MKNSLKILLLVTVICVVGGCSNSNSKNNIKVVYNDNNVEKLKNTVEQVRNFTFSGVVNGEDKNYNISGKVIVRDSISKSDIMLNIDDNEIYIINGKVYISYKYNNLNIIIKDSFASFIEEIYRILEYRNISFKRDIIDDILYDKTIKDIDFNELYKIYNNEYEDKKLRLNKDYLPKEIEIDNRLKFTFGYGDVSINVPLGYDMFTFTIDNLKNLLRVDNLGEVL